MEPRKEIAKAREVWVGYEDHGLLTATVEFDGGGWGQSIGLMIFGSVDETRAEPGHWDRSHANGMAFIKRLLDAFGVDRLDKIRGKTVLVTHTHVEILRIDPLPTEKGKPFDIKGWRESLDREEVPT